MTSRKTGRATGLVCMAVVAVCIVLIGSMMAPLTERAQAVTLQSLGFDQMCQYSRTVVVARTLSSSARLGPGETGLGSSPTIETVVQLQVLEVLKGSSPGFQTARAARWNSRRCDDERGLRAGVPSGRNERAFP
jgi:hypothetical protein